MRRTLAGLRKQTHAVILAGGAGTRFWPASRKHYPKPLLRVVGGKSLLEATIQRAKRFASPDHIWLVCAADHAGVMRRAAKLPAGRVLVEPRGRTTAMAVGFAAQRIAAEFPDAILTILPADHHVPDPAAFAQAIGTTAEAAADAQVLVTLGVEPTRPETGYGYIQVGKPVKKPHTGLYLVHRFVEKPEAETARRYVARGGFLWNAGVFVWTARTILEEIEDCAPEIHRALLPVARKPRGSGAKAALEAAYRRAPSDPIDVAVLEKSARVWTLPVNFHWSDVGTWESLAEELGVGEGTSRIVDGDVLLQEAPNNLVWGSDKPVVLLGVEGLAVIDTKDALLVAKLDRSPDVKNVVATLGKRKQAKLT